MFQETRDKDTGQKTYEVALSGKQLLFNSFLNKDTAFSIPERQQFKLEGLLPHVTETLDEQVVRVYGQYLKKETAVEKNIFLTQLYDRNETLFFRLMQEHLEEMVPIFYTPTVGDVVKQFNQNFRRPRGLFLSLPQLSRLGDILNSVENPSRIQAICITDSEAVLGIGDQGVGGIIIAIAKLAMYTLCGGFHPNKVLPIVLDVGTDNKELLQNPLYLGWRHERVRGRPYEDFIDTAIGAINRCFPGVFLHWEDFGKQTARRHLDRYQNTMCTFNDDMQGTAAVALAAILTGLKKSQSSWSDQRIVIYGAGTAGCAIADFLYEVLVESGLDPQEARDRIFLVDKPGLLHAGLVNVPLEDFQRPYLKPLSLLNSWQPSTGPYSLFDVVYNAKPTILIGTSAQKGAFSREIVKTMQAHCPRPLIFPLSNPTTLCEAVPADILEWTEGQALVVTGSPFAEVLCNGQTFTIGQCNNAFVFPGLALGIAASQATRVTSKMLMACAETISDCVDTTQNHGLLPPLTNIKKVSRQIAFAVGKAAQATQAAQPISDELLKQRIAEHSWEPAYVPYVFTPH